MELESEILMESESASETETLMESASFSFSYLDGRSPAFSHPEPPYTSPLRELHPRFPQKRETLSIDARFDQTPVLKKILDYYVNEYQPSANILPELPQESKHSLTRAKRKELRSVCSKFGPSVVSISSFLGVERKIECSGLIIAWSSSENEATILTSAKLLWSPEDSPFEFHLIVRMADGTLFLAKEDNVDYYHNLLTVKVHSTIAPKVVGLRSWQVKDIVEETNVIALGRMFYSYALCDYIGGKVYVDHPYFGCDELVKSTCGASVICEGGPLVTDTGYLVGINFFDDICCAHPLPTSVILTCLEMWECFSTVLWPRVGISVVDADQYPYYIWEQLNISHEESCACAVVRKVYEGPAKSAVRSRYLVSTVDGIPVQSAKEYSRILLQSAHSASIFAASSSSPETLTVIVRPCDRSDVFVSIEAEYIPVDDKVFCDCWPRVNVQEWDRKKFGSQENSISDSDDVVIRERKDFRQIILHKMDMMKLYDGDDSGDVYNI